MRRNVHGGRIKGNGGGTWVVEDAISSLVSYVLGFHTSHEFNQTSFLGTILFTIGLVVIIYKQWFRQLTWTTFYANVALPAAKMVLPYVALRYFWVPLRYCLCRALKYMSPGIPRCYGEYYLSIIQGVLGLICFLYSIYLVLYCNAGPGPFQGQGQGYPPPPPGPGPQQMNGLGLGVHQPVPMAFVGAHRIQMQGLAQHNIGVAPLLPAAQQNNQANHNANVAQGGQLHRPHPRSLSALGSPLFRQGLPCQANHNANVAQGGQLHRSHPRSLSALGAPLFRQGLPCQANHNANVAQGGQVHRPHTRSLSALGVPLSRLSLPPRI